MNRICLPLPAICLAVLVLFSCKKELKPATVEIVDQVRHYYPVIQGEILAITYEIENTSNNTLFIRELQTTCGCIIPKDDLPIVILPKRSGKVRLGFDTIKNSGYVEHYVWCYGNFADSTWREMRFTTNVVPPADYVHDYEQLYRDREYRLPTIRELVEGNSADKGYYTDDGIDPRERERMERQRSADELLGF